MRNCKQITRLLSLQHDEGTLSFKQRMRMHLHLTMCRDCREYRKQLDTIEQGLQQMFDGKKAE
ncbi:zf-HC2 domain-containing protein [Neisseria yangbaofengii]|uniref:zf-HC2 domain-containing protein n=1 Tax=Neisseria yangbaofengii TaxID=2709396 RepID=UPI0013EB0753|nr:zf-HC2 domain-containing protein [Neisseria yangbaofengii]